MDLSVKRIPKKFWEYLKISNADPWLESHVAFEQFESWVSKNFQKVLESPESLQTKKGFSKARRTNSS